jgi:hypothetical protein
MLLLRLLSGKYGMCADSGMVLLGLDVSRLNHLGPLLGEFDDKLAEFGRRAGKRVHTQIGKPGSERRINEGGINFSIEDSDDFGRRTNRSTNAIPTAICIAPVPRTKLASCPLTGLLLIWIGSAATGFDHLGPPPR